jgi:hypothetical protein
MSKFRAIMGGNFGPVAINKRLRELHERIDALEAELCKEPVVHEAPETVTSNSAEVVTLDRFDWQTCEDADDLREYALCELGLTVQKNAKAETVRSKITGFLETQGA